MADDAIPPALTASEWEDWYDGRGVRRPDRGGDSPDDPLAGEVVLDYDVPRVDVWDEGTPDEGRAYWPSALCITRPHSPADVAAADLSALMALANDVRADDDPGKLTWETVDDIRAVAAGTRIALDGGYGADDPSDYYRRQRQERAERLDTLADAIAALLPPRAGEGER